VGSPFDVVASGGGSGGGRRHRAVEMVVVPGAREYRARACKTNGYMASPVGDLASIAEDFGCEDWFGLAYGT